jgi:hypothetical protein
MTIKIKAVKVLIQNHPFFAARTKAGKPYKRREKYLKELRKQGVRDYLTTRLVYSWDKEPA